ncbi:peptidase S11 D-alanyl-D-alanine carboxypeptidase 1 [Actinobacteria bacterium OV450]|nr:peptidase S11 D-alanyl-D-alanine carboxypeptidase 1 [Actinobacteria bacterium OV450]
MKAIRVAGGSPDDSDLAGTTTAAAGPDDPSADPDTADVTEAAAAADDELPTVTPDAPAVEPKPKPKPEPAAEEDEGSAPDSPTNTTGGTQSVSDGTPTAEPEAGAEDDPDTEAKSPTPAANETEATPAPAPKPEHETRPTAAPKPAPDPKPEPESESAPEPKPESESESEPESAPAPEPEPAPESETTQESAPESKGHDAPADHTEPAAAVEPDEKADGTLTLAKPAPKPKAATRADAQSDAATDSKDAPASTADTNPLTDPEVEAEAEAEAEGDDTRTVTFRAPAEKVRRDADEEDRPTADAEDAATRAADPKPKPKPAARNTPAWAQSEEKAKAQANDKAQPEAQANDKAQPEAQAEGKDEKQKKEHDPELTRQLVALKPLDVPPRPTTPHAQPHPQAPTSPTTPKPPLDLLAELTNTPPPPETPRRTALRRVKVWTPILLLLAGAFAGAQLLRPLPTPHLVAAESTHTVNGQFSIPWPAQGQGAVRVPGSGDLGTFGEQKSVPIASVAKVMTAYVILKNHPLRKNDPGPDITIDAKTVADGSSEHESRVQGLTAGTKFSQQDVLKMLMIPSANNAARLLARWDTGTDSEAAFVEKMNAAARDLGMKDTRYTDPSGLDAGTVSTATDQLKLAEAAMKDEVFRSIVAMPSAPIKGLAAPLLNNNALLSVQGLSIRGIKTGSSTPAGGALMWAAYKSVGDETPLILGTLMQQRVDGPDPSAALSLDLALTNSRKIIEAVRTALASTPLVRKGDTVGYVDDGLGGRTPLVATKDLNVIGVPGQQLKLTLTAGAAPLPHKAKAGTELGTLTAGDGEGAKTVPVAVQKALPEPSFPTRLTRLR